MDEHRFRYPVPDEQLSPYGTKFWHSPYHLLACYAARPAFSARYGVDPKAHEQEGLTIVPRKAVQDWLMPIVAPAGEKAVALVEVYPVALGEKSVTFRYRIYKEGDRDNKLRSEMRVRFVFIELRTGKPVPVPQWFRPHILEVNPEAETAESI